MEHPYQERVLEERAELATKLTSLHKYVKTDNFNQLNVTNQMLLRQQVSVMDQYHHILEVRISLF